MIGQRIWNQQPATDMPAASPCRTLSPDERAVIEARLRAEGRLQMSRDEIERLRRVRAAQRAGYQGFENDRRREREA